MKTISKRSRDTEYLSRPIAIVSSADGSLFRYCLLALFPSRGIQIHQCLDLRTRPLDLNAAIRSISKVGDTAYRKYGEYQMQHLGFSALLLEKTAKSGSGHWRTWFSQYELRMRRFPQRRPTRSSATLFKLRLNLS